MQIRRQLCDVPVDSGPTCEAVRRWLAARPDLHTVAIYAARVDEVDLLPLMAAMPNRRWASPRVCGEHLVLHELRDWSSDLVPGAFGIREPSPALPLVAVAEVDAFLCPGLAFDGNGGRLGRGRGYYDRMLAHARPDAIKVGVCHATQRIADTFPQPHDIPMHVVIG